MRTLCALTALVALSCFSTACKSEDEDEADIPEVDCMMGTIPKYADVMVFTKCTNCHASTKTGAARVSAPTNINFDTESAAQMYAMKAAAEVAEGAMPPKDAKITISEQEKDQLYRWAQCSN